MKENLYTPNCIRTFTGKYMNVFEPTPEMICIEDIAHALACQPRFGGHLPKFYSVAQHSINCSYLVDDMKDRYAALLHDASEAYLCDIPKPIKNHLKDYQGIEHNLMLAIAKHFVFEYPLSPVVKEVDEQMLHFEWHHLMLKDESYKFKNHAAREVKETFLKTFHHYRRELSIK